MDDLLEVFLKIIEAETMDVSVFGFLIGFCIASQEMHQCLQLRDDIFSHFKSRAVKKEFFQVRNASFRAHTIYM